VNQLVRLLTFVLMASWAFAQPPQLASVAGSVVSSTGEPIKKAVVSLRYEDGRTHSLPGITTDGAGNYTIQDVEPGKYSVLVERIGYLARRYRGDRGQAFLAIEAGQKLTGVTIVLNKLGVISGKIWDEDGDPAPKCNVEVLAQRNEKGKQRNEQVAAVQSNDLGEYRIPFLAPGKYLIKATNSIAFGPGEGIVANFYPSTTNPVKATLVEVGAGSQIAGIDVRLSKERTYHVRGQVVDLVPGGTPFPRTLGLFRNEADASGGGGELTIQQNSSDRGFDFPAGAAWFVYIGCGSHDGSGFLAVEL